MFCYNLFQLLSRGTGFVVKGFVHKLYEIKRIREAIIIFQRSAGCRLAYAMLIVSRLWAPLIPVTPSRSYIYCFWNYFWYALDNKNISHVSILLLNLEIYECYEINSSNSENSYMKFDVHFHWFSIIEGLVVSLSTLER